MYNLIDNNGYNDKQRSIFKRVGFILQASRKRRELGGVRMEREISRRKVFFHLMYRIDVIAFLNTYD
jgi:hypothetical protein